MKEYRDKLRERITEAFFYGHSECEGCRREFHAEFGVGKEYECPVLHGGKDNDFCTIFNG